MAASFPGLTAADMPDGEGWAVERVTLSTHNGAHMDAPWRFHSTAADIEAELKPIGHTLQPLDIVVVNTRAGEVFGRPEYIHSGCGMGREATLYLTQRGVKVVGADAWSCDAPFSHTAKRWAQDRDPKIIWEGHKAGRETPYWQMEKLANLASLPPTGFQICCFPVNIKAASAGWSRVVAIFED